MTPSRSTELKDLVARHLDLSWDGFAREHPGLAAAIERTRLIETVVHELDRDPQFREAMAAADRDERILATALQLVDAVDRQVRRIIR